MEPESESTQKAKSELPGRKSTKVCKHCGDPGYWYTEKRRGEPYKAQKHCCQRCNNLLRKFKINRLQYDELLAKQGFTCAIEGCNRTHGNNGRPLCVDHCHTTGEIRGLLCDMHNTAIGKLGDDIEGLIKAINYLSTHVNGCQI